MLSCPGGVAIYQWKVNGAVLLAFPALVLTILACGIIPLAFLTSGYTNNDPAGPDPTTATLPSPRSKRVLSSGSSAILRRRAPIAAASPI